MRVLQLGLGYACQDHTMVYQEQLYASGMHAHLHLIAQTISAHPLSLHVGTQAQQSGHAKCRCCAKLGALACSRMLSSMLELAVEASGVHRLHVLHDGLEIHVSQDMLFNVHAGCNLDELNTLVMSLEHSPLCHI